MALARASSSGIALAWAGIHERGHGERVGIRGGFVHEDDGFDKGLRLNGAELCKLCGGGDKGRLGPGVTEEKRNLLGGERGVDGHGSSAGEQNGKVGDGPLRAIFGEDGDAVAVRDALDRGAPGLLP